eukprot:11920158-Ditylum_brightwellii.AAC.1
MNKRLCHGSMKSLLHVMRKWSKIISSVLWPFCYKNAEEKHNHLELNHEGLSPIERVLGQKDEIVADDFHRCGCPVFVLDSQLQNSRGVGSPKWDPRSRAGIYLGCSPVHAENIALVLNLQIGHVSPQYHLVFDDEFTTVPYLESDEEPPKWTYLVENYTERVIEEAFNISSLWYEGEGTSTDPKEIEEQAHRGKKGFVDVATIGLRRSKRIQSLKETKLKASALISDTFGFLITAVDSAQIVKDSLHQCYNTCKMSYSEYLGTIFDGTQNRMSIIGQ